MDSKPSMATGVCSKSKTRSRPVSGDDAAVADLTSAIPVATNSYGRSSKPRKSKTCRLPWLKIAFLEGGAPWVPFMTDRMDHAYDSVFGAKCRRCRPELPVVTVSGRVPGDIPWGCRRRVRARRGGGLFNRHDTGRLHFLAAADAGDGGCAEQGDYPEGDRGEFRTRAREFHFRSPGQPVRNVRFCFALYMGSECVRLKTD
tara:strand:+ start:3166 stop:3768 length:603 start_codon:yes stop_codon:yes gene_type:complete